MIDELHIKNHKDERCKTIYDPKKLKDKYPEVHFMSAEQTFVWLVRFRRILCAMPKRHHLSYLHRLINRRNNYLKGAKS